MSMSTPSSAVPVLSGRGSDPVWSPLRPAGVCRCVKWTGLPGLPQSRGAEALFKSPETPNKANAESSFQYFIVVPGTSTATQTSPASLAHSARSYQRRRLLPRADMKAPPIRVPSARGQSKTGRFWRQQNLFKFVFIPVKPKIYKRDMRPVREKGLKKTNQTKKSSH